MLKNNLDQIFIIKIIYVTYMIIFFILKDILSPRRKKNNPGILGPLLMESVEIVNFII